jgi:hypothetical protein
VRTVVEPLVDPAVVDPERVVDERTRLVAAPWLAVR